jgi:hypothetical protein
MNRNSALTIIALAVVGILVILLLSYNQPSQSPGEKIANSISEATEEITDEIDDHTTSK